MPLFTVILHFLPKEKLVQYSRVVCRPIINSYRRPIWLSIFTFILSALLSFLRNSLFISFT
ncbi:hypothetical protein PALI_b0381 [Pseudoalteromonas aliena SW19]|uniref:Uncharacterized protein n=1 Tax=Pseudoalteromonas aliena SW19 TaxID=1314866 RepID=A0ABR9E477_9GAMM|nr:hypothetical protein [Pseudoalteromonas aliena SW19]